eukprot:Nk52_evm49s152 gene=Nk52_evmTU49s152
MSFRIFVVFSLVLAGICGVSAQKIPMKVVGEDFLQKQGADNTYIPFGFMAGMNLGGSKPGYDPGELPVTKEDYLRYFTYIQKLKSNVVRVYTILPPDFYSAVLEYNTQMSPNDPIYVLQGVWTPEEELSGEDGDGRNAFEEEIVDIMEDNIYRCVAAIHGAGEELKYTSSKFGTYSYNIADYVAGFVVGTEWYPYMVNITNSETYGDVKISQYASKYKYFEPTATATRFEKWIAIMLDYTAERDSAYGYQHPVTFTNWMTTEPLWQPLEPLFPESEEDWQSVDPTHIRPKSSWVAGYFINFHSYPYSPDYLNYKFSDFGWNVDDAQAKALVDSDLQGVRLDQDPYFAFLERIRKYTAGFPLLITEVGLPTSQGSAHWDNKGRHHGHVHEVDQGKLLEETVHFMNSIGIKGVMLFALLDEWFKKSWNIMDIDFNRKNWKNSLSCEQYFGFISVEPEYSILLDGSLDDWSSSRNLLEPQDTNALRRFAVTHNQEYVFLLVQALRDLTPDDTFWIGFDTVPGGAAVSNVAELPFDISTDFILEYKGGTVTMYANIASDPYTRKFGEWLEGFDHDKYRIDDSSTGRYAKWRLLTKVPTIVPRFNSSNPVSLDHDNFEAADFIRGNTDPSSTDFDNLASWFNSSSALEIRVPWSLIGFSDPSTNTAFLLTNIRRNTTVNDVYQDTITMQVLMNDEFPRERISPVSYSFDSWRGNCYCERWKKGTSHVRSIYEHLRTSPNDPYAFSTASEPVGNSRFCECLGEATTETRTLSKTSEIHGYFAMGSFVFLMAQLFYAGIARPLASQLLYCYYFKKRTSKSSKALQTMCCFLFVMFMSVIIGFYVADDHDSMWTMVSDFFQENIGEDESFDIAYMIYLLSLIWDGLLVLCFSLLIKWPGRKKEKDLDMSFDDSEMTLDFSFDQSAIHDREMLLHGSGNNTGINTPMSGGVMSPNCPGSRIMSPVMSRKNSSVLSPPQSRNCSKTPVLEGIEVEVSNSENRRHAHAFVIACHNSSAKIYNTAVKILDICEPWQIFVADNGSSEAEIEKTEKICLDLSVAYADSNPGYEGPPINFGSIREGNKTIAQFATVYSMRNFDYANIEYVTLIDDDTVVPSYWNVDEVRTYFDKDPSVKCLAYPLCAGNTSKHLLPLLQNFEYLLAGYMKVVQAKLGTVLFASGAFSTWKVDYIVDILFRHDTMHHGDDLQQGLILHRLKGKKWILNPSEVHKGNYKVEAAGSILVPTDVPVCWLHLRDIVPWFLQKYVSGSACSCGEPSLFLQRAKGWDVSRQRFLWKYIKLIFSYQGLLTWRGFFARLVSLHDAILIINDWVTIIYGIVLYVMAANKIFFFIGLLIAWSFQTLVYIVFNWLILTPLGEGVAPEVRIIFPVVYKLPVLLVLRVYAMFYNILYYTPCVRNRTKVNRRLEEDKENEFKDMVEKAYCPDDGNGSAHRAYPTEGLSELASLRRQNIQRELELAFVIYKDLAHTRNRGHNGGQTIIGHMDDTDAMMVSKSKGKSCAVLDVTTVSNPTSESSIKAIRKGSLNTSMPNLTLSPSLSRDVSENEYQNCTYMYSN